MSEENIDLDDFGDMDGMDDFDMDFESETPDANRSPVERLAAGAFEKSTSLENAAQMAKAIADNALPSGYSTMKSDAGAAVDMVRDLYDKSAAELKEPINGLKKLINSNIDKISILPDSLKSRVKEATTVNEYGNSGATDADAAAISSTLEATFNYQTRAQAQAKVQEIANTEARDNVENVKFNTTTKYMAQIADASSRQLDYTEQVAMQYQRKMLELTQRQFFATRDLLNSQKGYNADSLSQLKGITKNTALPEFVKMRGSEAYIQLTRERLMGKLNENATSAMSNFIPNLSANISGKVSDMVGNVRDALEAATDVGDSVADMIPDGNDDDDDGMGMDSVAMAGGVGAGAILRKAASKFGTYLKDSGLADRYNIKETFDKYEYISENKGQALNDLIDSGKLGTAGDLLRELMPADGGGDNEQVMANLATNGTDTALFDEITRRSIVEIIPGYLSRMLQQLTSLVTGNSEDRLTFSADTEEFETMSSSKDLLMDRMFGGNKASGVMSKAMDMVEAIDPNNELPATQRVELAKRLINDVNATGSSKAFDLRTYATGDGDTSKFIRDKFNITSDVLSEGIADTSTSLASENLKLARTYRSMGTGYGDMELELNKLNAYGGKDVARELGIIGKRDGKDFINHDMKRELFSKYIDKDEGLKDRLAGRVVTDTILGKAKDQDETSPILSKLFKTRESDEDVAIREEAERLMSHDLILKKSSPINVNRLNGASPTNVSVDTTTIEKLIDDIPVNLRAKIFEEINGLIGMPVHVLSGMEQEAIKPTSFNQPSSPAGYPQEGLKKDIDEVKGILQGILDNSGTTTQYILNGSMPDGILDTAKKAAGGMFDFIRETAKGSMGLGGAVINQVGSLANKGIDFGKSIWDKTAASSTVSGAVDVINSHTGKVMLSARAMLDGEYFDDEGNVITKLEDIKGNVRNSANEIIASAADLKDRAINSEGAKVTIANLNSFTDTIKKGIGAAWGAQLNIASMAYATGKKGLSSAKGYLDKPMDIHVKGKGLAVRANELSMGGYRDQETGKVLLTIEDILQSTGPVVDSMQNVVISAADRAAGLTNVFGDGLGGSNALAKIKGTLGMGVKAMAGASKYMRSQVENAFEAVKKVGGGIWDKISKSDMEFSGLAIALPELSGQSGILRSIFNYMQGKWGEVEGVELPASKSFSIPSVKLKDVASKADELTAKAKDKVKETTDKVKGEATDLFSTASDSIHERYEQVINSDFIKDASATLVNAKDSIKDKIEKAKASDILSRINGDKPEQLGLDLGELPTASIKDNVTDRLDRLNSSIAKMTAKMMPADTDGVQTELDFGDDKEMQNASVKDIMSSMLRRLTPDKPKVGDADGDGDRDGGWLDQLKAKKAAAADSVRAMRDRVIGTNKDDKGDDDESSGVGGIIGMLLAGGGALVDKFVESLSDRISGMMSTVLSSTLGKIPGLGGMFSMGDDMPDTEGRRPGLFKRMAKGAAGGIWSAAKMVGKVGWGAAKLAGTAARAVALANPITASIAAVGLVAYGGYKLYNHLSDRKDAKGVEYLRFVQYGINTANEDELAAVRKLESTVMSTITMQGTTPVMSKQPNHFALECAEDFGVNTEDAREMSLWMNWFAKRFIPIMLTHLSAAVAIGLTNDVSDIESSLTDMEQRKRFVKAGVLVSGYGDVNPLTLPMNAWPGATSVDAIGIVSAARTKILEEATPSSQTDITNETKDKLASMVPVVKSKQKTVMTKGADGKQVAITLGKNVVPAVSANDEVNALADIAAKPAILPKLINRRADAKLSTSTTVENTMASVEMKAANLSPGLVNAMTLIDERQRYMIAQSEVAIQQRRQANELLTELLEMTVLLSGTERKEIEQLRTDSKFTPKTDVTVIPSTKGSKDIILPMSLRRKV